MKLKYKRKIRYLKKGGYRRKRVKRIRELRMMVMFLLMSILIFRGAFVSAGMNDSKLEKNRMDNIYAVANLNGETRLFYLNMYTMNGIVSYCIDIGVDITTDIYHSTTDFKVSKLTTEQIEYIRSISYFGYMYPGHEDYHYYIAAQELIWEYISQSGVEWTNELNVNGARIDISSYKRDILYLREKYYGGVYFNSIPKRGIFDLGDTITIADSSGLISQYQVSSTGHSKAWIDGENLVIQVGTDYVGEDKIELTRKNVYSYDSKLYYYDTSQRLVSAGNFGKKVDSFSFSIRGDSLNFVLVDGETGQSVPSRQASFNGITYGLYDMNGNFLEEIAMSDDIVNVLIDNLSYGKYVVRQLKTGTGYELNGEDILVSFNANTSLPIVLKVYPNYQEIELFKVYNIRGEGIYQPEVGISFSIYDNNGNLYDSLITDENGLASMLLPYGSYTIHQENTTFGYYEVDDFEIFVDPLESEKKRYDLVNDFIECQLKIVVSDENFSDVNLGSGFSFKIWDYARESYLKENGEEIFVTDENGILIFPVLIGYGKYRVEQVGVPDGFIDMEQELELFIDDHSQFEINDENLQIVVNFNQRLVMGEVHVLTEKEVFFTDENDYGYEVDIRPNVELELISQEDIVVYDQVLYEKDRIIQEFSTNELGKLDVVSLYLGKYCFKEKETELQECFELSVPKSGVEKVEVDVSLKLLLNKMNIEVLNQNEEGVGISDTVIEVMNKEKEVIYTGITDENGKMKVLSLPSGEYCFDQKKINNHYLVNEEDVCIAIDEEKEVWEVQIINRLVPKRWIEVPNTLDNDTNVVNLASLIFIIGFGGYFYRKKTSNNFRM